MLLSIPFVLDTFREDICCSRVDEMVGLILFNGRSAGGLANDTGLGARYTIISSWVSFSGTIFWGCSGFVLLWHPFVQPYTLIYFYLLITES